MRVWITRTEPGAGRQADALRAAGFTCVVAPVLTIEPLDGSAPPGPFDIMVFLSEHAVVHGLPRLARLTAKGAAMDRVQVLAVGARTASALAAAGWPAGSPGRADSEGLLAMPELEAPRGRRILLVCGADGRMLIANELRARGASVTRFVCYRRRTLEVAEDKIAAADVIVAGSADGLTQIARIWFRAGLSPDVRVLVPSERVRRHGVALGFRNVHDCGGSDTAALLRALERAGRAQAGHEQTGRMDAP